MDVRSEVSEFLAHSRARLTPSQAGLPFFGGIRRVPGLRREEVALLSGLSIGHYIRLERGDIAGASDHVLDAVARALQLSPHETAHLYTLARAAAGDAHPPSPRRAVRVLRPSLQRLIDAVSGAPAVIRGNRFNMMAANRLARALYAPLFTHDSDAPNIARFVFLDPTADQFYLDWDKVTTQVVATLGAEAERTPFDKRLTDLVGELSTRSARFRTLWGTHDSRFQTTRLRIMHPVVGHLDLTYDTFRLPSETGGTLVTYTAEHNSTSEEALRFLDSWATGTDAPPHPPSWRGEEDRPRCS